MFIDALVFSIIVGYILKGKIRNLENVTIEKVYIIFIAFGIEVLINIGIIGGLIVRGRLTFFLDLVMYILLFIFGYFNKKDSYIVIMVLGFLLNAIPIFLNGGAMPTSLSAIKVAGLTQNVASEGLYGLIDANTKVWFLGDIFPFHLPVAGRFVYSVGDILISIGLAMFVIIGMKKQNLNNKDTTKIH